MIKRTWTVLFIALFFTACGTGGLPGEGLGVSTVTAPGNPQTAISSNTSSSTVPDSGNSGGSAQPGFGEIGSADTDGGTTDEVDPPQAHLKLKWPDDPEEDPDDEGDDDIVGPESFTLVAVPIDEEEEDHDKVMDDVEDEDEEEDEDSGGEEY